MALLISIPFATTCEGQDQSRFPTGPGLIGASTAKPTFGNHGKGQVNGGLILTQDATHLG
jgi:hypothetical protein